jgi:uncharacterized protein YggU (UPF0235/DUF167 family)
MKQGRLIRVRVTPDAKRDKVLCVKPDVYEIEVQAPKERNEANARVRTLLAGALGVRVAGVQLMSGHHKSSKIFRVIE